MVRKLRSAKVDLPDELGPMRTTSDVPGIVIVIATTMATGVSSEQRLLGDDATRLR